MISKEIALTQPSEMWHVSLKNKDGTPVRCRSNGQCKTYKNTPDRYCLPVKHGMYVHSYIDDDNGWEWCLPDRWEIEKFWRQPD